MRFGGIATPRRLVAAAIAIVAIGTVAAWKSGVIGGAAIAPPAVAQSQPAPNPAAASGGAPAEPVLELTDKQLDLIKIGPAGTHVFPLQKEAVGSIDFNEDMSVAGIHALSGENHRCFCPGRR